MTPTRGLRLYQKRQTSGTTALEKPTGDMYRPNCTMNGMTKRKSRYLTLSAPIRRAGPRLASTAKSTNAGSKRICQLGQKLNQTIKPTNSNKVIPKSIRATSTEEEGISIRGK